MGEKYMTYVYKESHQEKLKPSLKYIQQLRHSRPQDKVSPYIPKQIHVHKKE